MLLILTARDWEIVGRTVKPKANEFNFLKKRLGIEDHCTVQLRPWMRPFPGCGRGQLVSLIGDCTRISSDCEFLVFGSFALVKKMQKNSNSFPLKMPRYLAKFIYIQFTIHHFFVKYVRHCSPTLFNIHALNVWNIDSLYKISIALINRNFTQ